MRSFPFGRLLKFGPSFGPSGPLEAGCEAFKGVPPDQPLSATIVQTLGEPLSREQDGIGPMAVSLPKSCDEVGQGMSGTESA